MSDLREDEQLTRILEASFDYVAQPTPVPPALRPERRVPLLLLLVAKGHGSGSSWKTLQLLNWAIRDPKNIELLVTVNSSSDIPDRPIVRFEPALDRAIDIAVGLDLLEQKLSGAFKLTTSGRNLVGQITGSQAFVRERELLEMLPGKISQRYVDDVLKWRKG